jgi:uncharacterized protein (DUF2141 family)
MLRSPSTRVAIVGALLGASLALPRHGLGAQSPAGASASPPAGGDLTVAVDGITRTGGTVRCALYANATGFPKDDASALQIVRVTPSGSGGVRCRFSAVPDGRYAIAVAHDLNDNGRVDANLVGQPTEPWGVTGGARPRFRPPRFEEAIVEVGALASSRAVVVRVAR